jgi:acyl-CoA synthetase (AMP-forming)/AMP-acid ligase II
VTRLQDRYWSADILGGPLQEEIHFGDRRMLCYAHRPPTLWRMFAGAVERYPDRPAVVEGRRLSYRELDADVGRIAAGMARDGFRKGDRLALLLGNRWEYIALILACARIGVIAVPVGIRQQRPELEFLLGDCRVRGVVFEDDLASIVPDRAAVPTLTHRYAMEGGVEGASPFTGWLVDDPVPEPADVAEEETAVILYTSGTTGRPKGALLTNIGIVHSATTFARCLRLTQDDRAMVAVPLSHVTGLVGVALSAICVGAAVVLMRQAFKVEPFLALASSERITFSILVPTIYTLAVMSPAIDTVDLSAWRIGCFGGAPMPVATIEMLAKKLPGLALINAYGATETTSPTTVMPLAAWRGHTDSVGQVVPCGQVRVVDTNGHDLPAGEIGELLIAGPMVVPGYHARPEANATEFLDGFWRSGDLGSIDEEGFVRIFDRRKDMINRGGFKIFSAEVENVLSHHDDVLECAIIGKADPVLGERVHAIIVPRPGREVDRDSVRRFCAARLADYKVPESVTILTEPLPRNSNGKIQKQALRSIVG